MTLGMRWKAGRCTDPVALTPVPCTQVGCQSGSDESTMPTRTSEVRVWSRKFIDHTRWCTRATNLAPGDCQCTRQTLLRFLLAWIEHHVGCAARLPLFEHLGGHVDDSLQREIAAMRCRVREMSTIVRWLAERSHTEAVVHMPCSQRQAMMTRQ